MGRFSELESEAWYPIVEVICGWDPSSGKGKGSIRPVGFDASIACDAALAEQVARNMPRARIKVSIEGAPVVNRADAGALPKITLLAGLRGSGKTYQAIQRAKATGKPFGVLAPNEPHARELRELYDVEAVSARMAHGHPDWKIVLVDDVHKVRLDDFRWIIKHAAKAEALILTSPPVDCVEALWLELLVDCGAIAVERVYGPRNSDLATKL